SRDGTVTSAEAGENVITLAALGVSPQGSRGGRLRSHGGSPLGLVRPGLGLAVPERAVAQILDAGAPLRAQTLDPLPPLPRLFGRLGPAQRPTLHPLQVL